MIPPAPDETDAEASHLVFAGEIIDLSGYGGQV